MAEPGTGEQHRYLHPYVQITGDFNTGDVYIAGMDEGGGGFPHDDTNYIFISTDGGNTWQTPTPVRPFQDRVLGLSVISRLCFRMTVATGVIKAGVSPPL